MRNKLDLINWLVHLARISALGTIKHATFEGILAYVFDI